MPACREDSSLYRYLYYVQIHICRTKNFAKFFAEENLLFAHRGEWSLAPRGGGGIYTFHIIQYTGMPAISLEQFLQLTSSYRLVFLSIYTPNTPLFPRPVFPLSYFPLLIFPLFIFLSFFSSHRSLLYLLRIYVSLFPNIPFPSFLLFLSSRLSPLQSSLV